MSYFAVTWFDILPQSLQWVHDPRYATAFWIVISAWVVSTFLHSIIHIYGRAIAEKSASDMDDRLVDLLELVIRYVIWFAAVLAILKVFEIEITPLLAGAGVAGIAVALAAQDLISNFFGGAIIYGGQTLQGRRPGQDRKLLRGCPVCRHPQYPDQDS